ncbi:nucleoside phosphatase family-domain-containing protein [Absidia repens]|uniref:Nucleoside phosphatase family-domain-containing protein n=1 Tax=Absidia repens TaxID=90262 RepID=A0A1X2I6K3_9FUNG|nr:nucleoside phosphatase family-domain-containing protein [Absidia repens]
MASHVELLKRRPLTPLEDQDWENNRRYGVIIDAGSSGSRVYVYSWKDHDFLKSNVSPDDLRGSIPIVERADKNGLKWTHRQEPGISTFGSRPNEVGEHLQGLLDFAQEVVPMHLQPSTPIFLMATAGVRLLPLDEQSELMEKTCHFIKENSGFFVSHCGTHIRAIPGELEGVYGWVAINYLMGGFDASIQSSLDQQGQQEHTFGFLDMGGASAQIAFEPDHHQKEEHSSDLTKVHLRTLDGSAVDYDVFVTTFLGYGSNEARRRYLEQRVKMAFDNQQQTSSKTKDGNDTNATTSGLLDDRHRLHLDDPCLPLNLELTDADTTSVPLQLKGTGKFDACLEATLPLLNKDAECPTQPCLFNGVHTPKIDWSVHQFVGISEYWYSSHDVLGLGGVYDFTEYEQKATAFCEKDWSLEVDEHPEWEAIEIQRYQLQCFKSAWMVNVLHGGIEVPRMVDTSHSDGSTTTTTQWMEQSIESVEHKNWNPPFRSIDTINDIQVSWTLGAMLLHVANQIPLSEDGDGGIRGHSSDDEQAHPIADGVELPSADGGHHYDSLPGTDYFPSAPNDASDSTAASWWDLGNTVSVIGLSAMLIVLFGVVLWEWYRYAKKRRRSHGEYRRVDTNGGILGVGPNSPSTTSSSSSWSTLLAGPIMVMKQVTVRPMVVLRYWTSRFVSYWGSNGSGIAVPTAADETAFHVGMSSGNTEMDHLDTSGNLNQDSVSITMYQQGLQQQPQQQHQYQPPVLAPSALQSQIQSSAPNGNLGPSNKSSSMISMKYWHKKRYSGDSHHIAQMIQPGYNNHLDRGGATSAIGLANRSNSSSNLVARTNSPSLSGDGAAPLSSSSTMSRSRSRIGFAIHETSDEDDYLTVGDNAGGGSSSGLPTFDPHRFGTSTTSTTISRTPSPSQPTNMMKRATTSNSSAAPSPKASPRSSLEKRRKDETD